MPFNLLALAQNVPNAQRVFGSQVDAAGKEAGVRVALTSVGSDTFAGTLNQAIAAGQPPDATLVGTNDSVALAARGLLRDLRFNFDRIVGLNGEIFPPLGQLATAGAFSDPPPHVKPPIWAIPYVSVGNAWLGRQDLLTAQGIQVPSSYDELIAALRKTSSHANGSNRWSAPLPVSEAGDNLVQTVFLSFGASLFDPAGLRSVVDPTTAAPALQALSALYQSNDGTLPAPPGTFDSSAVAALRVFLSGQAVFTIDYGGAYAAILGADPTWRDRVVAFTAPSGPTGRFTTSQTSMFVIFDRSPVADRAGSFVERLTQPARYDELTRAGLGSVIPPYAYLTKGPFWDDDPNFHVFATNARGDPARGIQFAGPGEPAPLTLPVGAVRNARLLARAARDVVSGQLTPTIAASALRDRCVALTHASYAEQPLPSPTAEPTWLQLVRQVGFTNP